MLTRLAVILALMLHPAAIVGGDTCRTPARNQDESGNCCCGDSCLEVTAAAVEVCGCAESGEPGSQPLVILRSARQPALSERLGCGKDSVRVARVGRPVQLTGLPEKADPKSRSHQGPPSGAAIAVHDPAPFRSGG